MAMMYQDNGRMGMPMHAMPQPQGQMPSQVIIDTAHNPQTGAVGTSATVVLPNGHQTKWVFLPQETPRVGTPVRESFARPSMEDDMRRRRSASVVSGSEYNYHAPLHSGGPRLIDRIQGTPNLMQFGSQGDRFSNCSTPPPALTRGEFGDDGGFARPYSRMSNASSHRSNGGPINYNPQGGNPRFRPYSQASNNRPFSSNSNNRPYSTDGSRPYSRNSYQTNNSYRSFGTNTTSVRYTKDTYVPIYDDNSKVIGQHPSLPEHRRRDWFTPLNEKPKAGLEVRNLIAGTTLQDIYSTFMEYGTIDVIELLDDYTNEAGEKLLSVLIVFEQRDDADKAHHTMNDVVADDQTLKLRHVDPERILRPNADSADTEKSLRPGRQSTSRLPVVKEEPGGRAPSAIGDEDTAMSTGSRTPAPSLGARTPVPQSASTPKHSSSKWEGWRGKPEDTLSKTSENNGWGSGNSTLNGSAAGETEFVEWGSGGKGMEVAPVVVDDNDGWGPAAEEEPEITLE